MFCYDVVQKNVVKLSMYESTKKKILVKSMCDKNDPAVKESDSDTIIMVIVLVAGVGGVFILFALMALCYR